MNTCDGDHTCGKCDRDDCDFERPPAPSSTDTFPDEYPDEVTYLAEGDY